MQTFHRGHGLRRVAGRITAPKPNTEKPVVKSLCKIEKVPKPIPKQDPNDLPPPNRNFEATDLYSFKVKEGKNESWNDVIYKKRFAVSFGLKNKFIEMMAMPEKAYIACFIDLMARTYKEMGSYHMFVGFEIRNSTSSPPICLPYVPIDNIDEEILIKELSRLRNEIQPPLEFYTHELELTIIFVKQLTGSGIAPKRTMGEIESAAKKRVRKNIAILMNNLAVNDVKRLCLGTAIIQGIAYLEFDTNKSSYEKEEKWRKLSTITEDKIDILNEAKDLLTKAGIEKETDFTIKDVEMLQQSLAARYQLLVLTDASNKTPVFKGPGLMNKNVIPLLHSNGHFQLITRLASYMGSQFYCVQCNVRYQSIKSHHNCPLRCRLCMEFGCVAEEGVEIRCENCKVSFFSIKCFDAHKMNGLNNSKSMCESMSYCSGCDRSFKKTVKHECNVAYCQHCQTHRPKGHTCTLFHKLGGGKTAVKEKLIFLQFQMEVDSSNSQPILAMALRCCTTCFENKDEEFIPKDLDKAFSLECSNCSPGQRRLKIFERMTPSNRDRNVLKDLMTYIVQQAHERYVFLVKDMPETVSDFILNFISSEGNVPAQNISLHRTRVKFMILKGNKIRFVDLNNFVPGNRAETRNTIGLNDLPEKVFPSNLLKSEYFNYVGEVPDLVYYKMEEFTPTNWHVFQRLHETWKNEKRKFSFQDELFEASFDELSELSFAVMHLEKAAILSIGIRPIEEAEDIFKSGLLAYRRSYLTDGIFPLDVGLGAKFHQTYSVVAMQYLAWRAKKDGVCIDSSINVGEYRVPGTPYHLDGFIQPNERYPRGLGIDYKGCYWHAHACAYVPQMMARRELNIDLIRANDKRREDAIKPHCELETVWECEVALQRKMDPEMHEFMRTVEFNGIVETANALYPPRSEVLELQFEATNENKIYVKDISSLILEVLMFGEFPASLIRRRHGEEFKVPIRTKEELTSQVKGILYCRVQPPKNLVWPVLPYKVNDFRTIYPLCAACAESPIWPPKECSHEEKEREMTGTWSTFELALALEHGYVINSIIGAQHWGEWQTYERNENGTKHGLFSEYLEQVVALKVTSSGFSKDAKTQMDKEKYVEKIWKKYGVKIDTKMIRHSPIMSKAVTAIMQLPSQFGERTDVPTTSIVDKAGLWKTIEDATSQVKEIRVATDEKIVILSGKKVEHAAPKKETVLMVPALADSQLRVFLYKMLSKKGVHLLYLDEKTVIYSGSRESDPLSNDITQFDTDSSLDNATKFLSHMPGTFGIETNSTDKKFYLETKGLSWPRSIQKYRLEAMKSLVEQFLEGKPDCTEIRYHSVKRDAHDLLVQVPSSMLIYPKLDNRMVLSNGSTVPLGYSV